jgi:hypothetical protein
MTQEELDALMNGGVDGLSEEDLAEKDTSENNGAIDTSSSTEQDVLLQPLTNDNKVVYQLDDVTKDSEEKAIQIFDVLETISGYSNDTKKICKNLNEIIESKIELFEKLHSNFPNISAFKESLDELQKTLEDVKNVKEVANNTNDQTLMAMDIMQYQDIHRQKIERVVNVMRALSKYMNSLFEGQKSDDERTSSAQHISGDSATEDLVDDNDIEALIAAFGS